MQATFEGKNENELLANIAAYLAGALAKRDDETTVEPQGGDSGGPG